MFHRRAAPKQSEKSLYRPCLRFLNSQPGTKAWLNYNGGVWIPSARRFVRKSLQEDGLPDITGVKNGKAFAFEIKAKGRLRNVSPAQRNWMEHFHECGGIAFVVDTIEDLEAAWKQI